MPLKHSTETLLVFFLGIAIVIAGFVCALLPPLVVTPIPWVVAFGVALAYPLSLYPLFKERRADYLFRGLHFTPALILLIWFLLQVLATYYPIVATVLPWYTWGWSTPVVIAGFLTLFWFCLRVIRQWTTRAGLLTLLLVPFVFLGMLGEKMQWPSEVASVLWNLPKQNSTGAVIASVSSSASSKNLEKSLNETEEKYRAELRRIARRQIRVSHLQLQPASVHGATYGAYIASQSGSLTSAFISSKPKGNPPHLPSSGMGVEAIFLAMCAGYCAVLHERARQRVTRYL
jgi:hypothetical protein